MRILRSEGGLFLLNDHGFQVFLAGEDFCKFQRFDGHEFFAFSAAYLIIEAAICYGGADVSDLSQAETSEVVAGQGFKNLTYF